MIEAAAIANRLRDAFARRACVDPPTSQDPRFDLATAYAVEAEHVRVRAAEGHRAVGVKVAFANRAAWPALKLGTVAWAHMYDDTVHYARDGRASLPTKAFISPRIEPEMIFRMARGVDRVPATDGASLDARAILEYVEALAVGFEIVHTVYGAAKYQPADFVAAYGHHAALVVGDWHPVEASEIDALADALPRFTVRLSKDGALVAQGSGTNVLQSPALCLAELHSAMTKRAGTEPLKQGDLVSSGSLTDAQPIAAGQVWRVEVDGIDLNPLSLTLG
jgi:2-oxo-3-hexenedioate decarboxylase